MTKEIKYQDDTRVVYKCGCANSKLEAPEYWERKCEEHWEKKAFCEICDKQVTDKNVEEHLHGNKFVQTYMPGVYIKPLLEENV